MNIREASLYLFKALPITKKKTKEPSEVLMKATIERGFIFAPEIVDNYYEYELLSLAESIGLTGVEINASFHKSWEKVRDANIEQLVIEQILHYFTTYGFEALGIYDKDSVYVPREELDVPDIDVNRIKLVIIKGYTKAELKEKILKLLETGIALKEETRDAVWAIALETNVGANDLDRIRNKEVLIGLCEYLGIVPKNPTEFLRYLIFKATGETLIIKNHSLISKLKEMKDFDVAGAFKRYEDAYGLERLATIFHRYKPLWLAFKSNEYLSSKINRLRKLADKYHRPFKGDYLNEVTSHLKLSEINLGTLVTELDKVNLFRRVRVAYALQYRALENPESILYRIRNGKGFATDFHFEKKKEANTVLGVVLSNLTDALSPNVKGKTFYIPEYMHYTLPATEKMFSGNMPTGSYVVVEGDLVFGVHWKNQPGKRVDLDLSMRTAFGDKIGWDGDYRSTHRDVLFSGDIVDAQNKYGGATELFYVASGIQTNFMVSLNYYNGSGTDEAPFTMIIANETPDKSKFSRHGRSLHGNHRPYMVDPNNVVLSWPSKITGSDRQKILGIVVTTPTECRIFFTETGIGTGITARNQKFMEHSQKYLANFYMNPISLNDLIVQAGGKVITEIPKPDPETKEVIEYVDLSPENLEKDTIINLLTLT